MSAITYYSLSQGVRVHLEFLFEEFGFREIHTESYPKEYNNSLVLLESNQCRIRVLLEKNQIFIEFGTIKSPANWSTHTPYLWFDMDDIISFLNQQSISTRVEIIGRVSSLNISEQLQAAAVRLQPWVEKISLLFAPEIFPHEQQKLIDFRKKRANQWLASLYKQNLQ